MATTAGRDRRAALHDVVVCALASHPIVSVTVGGVLNGGCA